MRDDVVEARSVIDHPMDRVWGVVGTPDLYPRFVPAVSWFEISEHLRPGHGPTCLVRLTPRRDTVVELTVQAVVYRAGEHIVWCGVDDDRRWVSLELQPMPGNRTELVVQLMMHGLEREYSDVVSPSAVRRTARDVARRINRHLSGRPALPSDLARNEDEGKSTTLGVASTLVKAGVLTAGRPDKMARQLGALAKWGATVVGAYSAAAARGWDEIAVHDERGTRTFGQIEERTTRLANGLAERGVTAGRSVALMARNHAGMIESIVACGKLGADVVLCNTGLSPQSVAGIVAKHEPAAVLIDDEFAPMIRQVPGDFARISTWADTAAGYPTVDELIAKSDDTRLQPVDKPGRIVVLTSGTTGLPKGARRPTPKGLSTAASVLARIPLRQHDRIFIAAPLFHTWGLAGMHLSTPLRSPLSLRRKFDAEETLKIIAEHKCTALLAVPIMLQRILDLPDRIRTRYDLSALRIVASSGSALAGSFVTEFMNAFGNVLYNLYGSTEVSWASIADPVDLRAAPTTAGRCPPGTLLAVLDEKGTPVPPGAEGTIYVGNEMLFDGYTDGGSLPTSDKLMSTGDLGYLDADGRLFVTGRADEMIVSGGENVFPRPVEEALIALPQVSEVAVVGVADQEYGQRLAAYLVLRPGAYLDADDVRGYIHQRLARYAVPRDVYFVPELPRNATGKILKRLLNDDTWPITN